MKQTSAAKRDAVFRLRDGGMCTKDIAVRLKMGKRTVQLILQEGPLCCLTCGEKLYRYDPDETCQFCVEERELGIAA